MSNDSNDCTQVLAFVRTGAGGVQSLRRALICDPISHLEFASRLTATQLPKLAHVVEPSPELPDVMITIPATPRSVAHLARAIGVDSHRCTWVSLLVVRRHTILPGRDRIRLVFALRRLDRLTLEQFHAYWLHHHAQIGRRLLPPFTYHQLHTDPAATGLTANETGVLPATFDGIVEVHFPDLSAFVAQLSKPEVAEEALADERNFIDHGKSAFWLYEEEALTSDDSNGTSA